MKTHLLEVLVVLAGPTRLGVMAWLSTGPRSAAIVRGPSIRSSSTATLHMSDFESIDDFPSHSLPPTKSVVINKQDFLYTSDSIDATVHDDLRLMFILFKVVDSFLINNS